MTDKTAGYLDSLDLGFVNRIRGSFPGTVVGHLSTLLKSLRLRDMYKEVLETPVMALDRPVQGGQLIEVKNEGFRFYGAFGSFRGSPMIFVNPYTTPTDIVKTLFEEGAHALRRAKGWPLRKQDLSQGRFDEEAYRTDPEEVSAKKMVEYAMDVAREGFRAMGVAAGYHPMRQWLGGDCDLFALALSERLPYAGFVGVFKPGTRLNHHIALKRGDRYLDARGELDESGFLKGLEGSEIRPIGREDVVGYYNPAWVGHEDELRRTPEMREALRAVQKVYGHTSYGAPGRKVSGTELSPQTVPSMQGWNYDEPLPDRHSDFFELVENPHTDQGRETGVIESGAPPPEGGNGKPARGEPGQEGSLVRPMASSFKSALLHKKAYNILAVFWVKLRDRILLFPNRFLNHDQLLRETGLPASGPEYDRMLRGRVFIDRERRVVRFTRHGGGYTPNDVVNEIVSRYSLQGWDMEDEGEVMDRYGSLKDKSAAMRGVWFHGSSIRNLESILHQGLVPELPDPSRRNWAKDPDISEHSPSRESYGGIYVTRNLLTAVSAPRDHNTEGREVVVCMDLQPSTFYMDEDAVVYMLQDPIGGSSHVDYYVLPAYLAVAYPDKAKGWGEYIQGSREKYTDKVVKYIQERFHEASLHPGLEERLRELAPACFAAALARIASHMAGRDDYYLRGAWARAFSPEEGDKAPLAGEVRRLLPAPEEGERLFREEARSSPGPSAGMPAGGEAGGLEPGDCQGHGPHRLLRVQPHHRRGGVPGRQEVPQQREGRVGQQRACQAHCPLGDHPARIFSAMECPYRL